mmetsp:Transcript_17339/g.33822  ORF Transcript_17339/g.33822 Transcript_17339/m.33822 type:complete len:321 (+) Transcript_17339:61-1023(+)|eukprot:CAMPEP_0175144512 /NCGR_PEP_ID=MMETSP0087-20121206/14182_1 /TAXON_ID=136419 /ORGANISM="Unknown Unknown, Strain D1" /LENGTH=320 /DNA_ID=CAMNT_0016429007 /DNA_START=14 /DNA_END=976 /DNA_ORIENTATION=+
MAHVVESCIAATSVDRMWQVLAPFDFQFLENVSEVKVNEPASASLGAVGSVCTIVFNDNRSQTFRILINDPQHYVLKYEVIQSNTTAPTIHHTIRLEPVTTSNQTFVQFETKYSTEIPLKDYVDSKLEKRRFFYALTRFVGVQFEASNWACQHCTLDNTPETVKCNACDKDRPAPAATQYSTKKVPIPFNSNKQNEQQFTTAAFQCAGHTWELLIFPRGNQGHRQPAFMSVYLKILDLEMGGTEQFLCHFKFRLLRPQQPIDTERELGSYHAFSYKPDQSDRGFTEVLSMNDHVWYLDENENLNLQVSIAPLFVWQAQQA